MCQWPRVVVWLVWWLFVQTIQNRLADVFEARSSIFFFFLVTVLNCKTKLPLGSSPDWIGPDFPEIRMIISKHQTFG